MNVRVFCSWLCCGAYLKSAGRVSEAWMRVCVIKSTQISETQFFFNLIQLWELQFRIPPLSRLNCFDVFSVIIWQWWLWSQHPLLLKCVGISRQLILRGPTVHTCYRCRKSCIRHVGVSLSPQITVHLTMHTLLRHLDRQRIRMQKRC